PPFRPARCSSSPALQPPRLACPSAGPAQRRVLSGRLSRRLLRPLHRQGEQLFVADRLQSEFARLVGGKLVRKGLDDEKRSPSASRPGPVQLQAATSLEEYAYLRRTQGRTLATDRITTLIIGYFIGSSQPTTAATQPVTTGVETLLQILRSAVFTIARTPFFHPQRWRLSPMPGLPCSADLRRALNPPQATL